ncbi:heterokaryon incompatibility protein-domain-containing protein [Lophiotrema nucula]|uniref:Heterokaryon incompatibility protein-domain-containing protein n=1 Tax=Lophiotrema nucula TaxID=690887 RepID=A0A6A5YVI7_9PLEO|nr:heterokaryon incompatibility protein-domain-containing protein [Lophiotrema nucula]
MATIRGSSDVQGLSSCKLTRGAFLFGWLQSLSFFRSKGEDETGRLQQCRKTHLRCRMVITGTALPLWVLDVSQRDLVKLIHGGSKDESHAGYVTLSYTWGNKARFLMISSNMKELQEGINSQVLPRTFRDAVTVTLELGYRYLWVDALCIQQDSPDQVVEQMALMGQIFRGSSLTIFAAAAADADAGLACIEPTDATLFSIPIDPRGTNISISDEVLLVRVPHKKHLGSTQSLYKRGWVLQEEVLASRGLSFWSDQIRWRCCEENSSECLPFYKPDPDDVLGPRSEPWREGTLFSDAYSTLREILLHGAKPDILWKPPINSSKQRVIQGCRGSSQEVYSRQQAAITIWYDLVDTYCSRHLSFLSDTLHGVAGIASLLGISYDLTYSAGLWEEDIQKGLMWQFWKGSARKKFDDDSDQPLHFPSWSCASRFGGGIIHWDKNRLDRGLRIDGGLLPIPEPEASARGPLKIHAHTKWVKLLVVHYGYHYCQYYVEAVRDQRRSIVESAPPSRFYARKLWSPRRLLNEDDKDFLGEMISRSVFDSSGGILIILCMRVYNTSERKVRNFGIAVTPVTGESERYKRIGIVYDCPNDWFGNVGTHCDNKLPPAERMTLELV